MARLPRRGRRSRETRTVTCEGCNWNVAAFTSQTAVIQLDTGRREVAATQWLCFWKQDETRRLADFPGDWKTLHDSQLAHLLAEAKRCPRPEWL